jgi:hypothetical protein
VKKVMLVLGALVMVVSGVAAVSAYEAHIINVTAKIENAMDIDPESVAFDTVFPEEWFTRPVVITTSISFCADDQTRAKFIYFKVFAAWKQYHDNDPRYPDYYPWLGEAVYLKFCPDPGIDPPPPNFPPTDLLATDMTVVGAAPSGPPGVKPALGGQEFLIKKYPLPPDLSYLMIGLDVPVFEGYWNEHTDVETKPSGLSGPSWEIPRYLDDGVTPNPAWNPDGVDLGLDLIIQVTAITETPKP